MDPFQDLLTQSPGSQVSPELLEMIGSRAAAMFTENGVPLNDGISQLLAGHPELGNEHIRRVVEFANNSAFQTMFEKGQDKNVHFPVADPGVILRDLKDGGTPAHDGKPLDKKTDYLGSPGGNDQQGDAELTQLFAGQPQETPGMPLNKVAAEEVEVPHAEHTNPVDNVYDTHVRLEATRAELATRNDAAHTEMKLAQQELYDAIKHEVLAHDGAGLNGVMSALEHVGGRDKVAMVLPGMIQRMVDEGIPVHILDNSLVKTASGVVVNPNHPLVLAWRGMMKAAEQRVILDQSVRDVDQGLRETTKFLRSQV